MAYGGVIKLTGESEYRKALSQITKNLTLVSSEMKIVNATFDKSDNSIEALTSRNENLNDKLAEQKDRVNVLEKALEDAKKETGENSETTKRWQIELNKAKAEVITTTKEIDKNEKAMKDFDKATDGAEKELKDFTDTADKSTGKLKGFLSGIGSATKGIMAGVGGAIAGLGAGLVASVEGSKEFNDNMTKLVSASQDAGYSVEYAKEGFQNLYGILGDETTANTTMSNFMAMETSQENLNTLLNASAGIWAKYGDSIPLDGLAESINETAKVGAVTGGLADALNWAGINEDDFNAKLEKTSSEAERQKLITETLDKTYGELGKKYQENNKAMISYNEAQMQMKESMAEIGTAFTPVLAMFTQMGAGLLSGLVPQIQELGGAFTDLFNGVEGSQERVGVAVSDILMSLVQSVVSALPQIAEVGVSIFQGLIDGITSSLYNTSEGRGMISMVIQIVDTLVNGITTLLPQILQAGIEIIVGLASGISESLPDLIPTIVDTVVTIFETLIDNIDLIIDAGIQLLLGLADGIIEALPRLLDKVPVIIEKLFNAFINNFPKIVKAGGELIGKLAVGIIGSLGTLLSQAPRIISTLVSGIMNGLGAIKDTGKNLVAGIWEGISGSIDWLKSKITGWVGNVTSFLKELFGIHSPSTLFRDEIGTNLALGVGEGFESSMSDVNKQMANAIQTDYDLNVGANINGTTETVSDINYNNIVNAFKDALTQVKVMMNDREMGTFVTDTVERVVFT